MSETPIGDAVEAELAVDYTDPQDAAANELDGLVTLTDNGPEEGAEEAPQDEQLEIADAELDEGEDKADEQE
jgi:hypothetical protein